MTETFFFFSGMCGYSKPEELQSEVGGAFTPEISNIYADAMMKMISQVQPHAILSLESGGIFMRSEMLKYFHHFYL